jgi:hypothetical protein
MILRQLTGPGLFLAAVLTACGGDPVSPPPPPPPPPPAGSPSVVCASKSVTTLSTGQHTVIDPATASGCLRFPAAGPAGAQYLVVVASTSGARSSSGIQGPYVVKASSPASASASAPSAALVAPARVPRRSVAAEFDAMLRERERALVAGGAVRASPPALPRLAAPPTLGEVKSFRTCSNLQCSAFATVQATARFVGQKVAVFIDNDVPQNDPLTPADAAELGTTFDTYHYPIDVNAFGSESDLDQNGVVIILMTDAVNDLTPDCTDGRVVGYFFGGDLLTGPNSNNGEVFYTLVPAPSKPNCTAITRTQAVNNLKPTLIHEFQHMISFNQHVLVRSGNSEETWLNEGLSHFAEELGGRLIPNSECTPEFSSCRSQYSSGNILNSYDYLKDTEAHFLVFPTSSGGSLEERGAAWLFVRWIADQFAADTILGTDMTRKLVQTALTGAANINSATGSTLPTMIPQWLMALYLDDGPDLPEEPTGRLRYKSWGLRAIWTNPLNQAPNGPFNGFPLVPPVVGGSFSHSGTLRGGSGKHFLVIQQANAVAIDMLAVRSAANDPIDPLVQPRLGVVRIR